MPSLLTTFLILISISLLPVEKLKGDLLISNINVIDVKSGKVRSSVDVVISKGKIAKIVTGKSTVRYEVSQTVDGRGKFLIPGLWICTPTLGQITKTFSRYSWPME